MVTFSLRCVFQMRFYEVVTPLRAQLSELSVKRGTLTEDLDTHRTQMRALMEVRHTYTPLNSTSVCCIPSFSV